MTWLTNVGGAGAAAGTTASTAAQTGGQLAAQTAASAPSAVSTGAIGQTGITGGLSTPAYSAFPNASAKLAQYANDPVGSLYSDLKAGLQERLGMNSETQPSSGQPSAGGGARSLVHGMLSARKAPPLPDANVPLAPSGARQRSQVQGGTSIEDILAGIFQGQG